ncbi:MAG TPA: hypothetical protein PLW65_30550, partial [Pseudomonadota bacterium]|nr:hypothetical protein [Pseudomonadota bacterium]
MELLGALKGYFEATMIGVGGGSPYWAAFDALRRNQHLAQAFVGDLQSMLEFLDRELVPALSQGAPGSLGAPPSPEPAVSTLEVDEGEGINDAETLLLHRLPPEVQADMNRVRGAAGPEAAAEPPRPA